MKVHRIEQEINKFLSVPIKLQIIRECLLYLFIKMYNSDSDITVERSCINSSNGTNKTVYTVTIYN